jgi:hypothetical protein
MPAKIPGAKLSVAPPDARLLNDENLSVVAAPFAVAMILAAPAVDVSVPRVSLVAKPVNPVNCKVPPADWVTPSAENTTVFVAADGTLSDAAAVALSLRVPF